MSCNGWRKKWNSPVLYVDGKPIGKGPLGLNEKLEKDIKDVRLDLGQEGRCNGEFGHFKGLLNEFTVYTRLLSDTEVPQSANSDRGLAIEPIHKLPSIWGNLKF